MTFYQKKPLKTLFSQLVFSAFETGRIWLSIFGFQACASPDTSKYASLGIPAGGRYDVYRLGANSNVVHHYRH